MSQDQVLNELLASEIRGRGERRLARGKEGQHPAKGTMDKYVVCNADESEPGTFKDRELMQKTPHMLIEGIVIAAYGGAGEQVVHLHPRRVRGAGRHPRRRRARGRGGGHLGTDILGSGLDLSMVVHRGAGAYICGEETGLLARSRASAATRPEAAVPANQGLYQSPTA